MSVTWRHEGAGGPERDLALLTLACVERTPDRVTMEWRREMRDGRREVIAARFRPDGRIVGAWRGPPGGAGEPLRIVRGEFDEQAARREMERRTAPLGVSLDDAESSSSATREVVETPAGRFRCTVRRFETSLLFTSVRMTWACSEEPIPLSPIVRMEWRGTGMDYVQQLVAIGETGAAPTLRLSR